EDSGEGVGRERAKTDEQAGAAGGVRRGGGVLVGCGSGGHRRSGNGLSLIRQIEHARQRDADPCWAIVELVEEFVERLLEQICVEQTVCLLGLRSKMRGLWVAFCFGHAGAPCVEEFSGDGVLPELCPWLECAGSGGIALGEAVQRGV